MADDRISSYIDLQSISKETEEILRQINQVYTGLKELNNLKVTLDGANTTKEAWKAAEALRQKQAELNKMISQHSQANAQAAASQQKLNTNITEAEKALAASKVAMQERNKELKLTAQLENAEAGTLQALRAELNLLNNYKNTKLQVDSDEYREAEAKVAALNKSISEIEKRSGDHRRSVGDYFGALAPLFEKVTQQIIRLKSEQQGLQDLSKRDPIGFQVGGGAERLNQVNASLQNLQQIQEVGFKTTGNQIQQIQTLEKSFESLASSGTASTDFVEDFNTALSQAKTSSYTGSAKIIIESMEQARVKVERLTSELGENNPATQAARAEFEALQRVTSNPQFLNIAGKVGDATGELRGFQKVLIDLERQGQGNTNFAQELRAHLAALTDEIGDARAEIKAMSSDTRSFDLAASGINTLASAYQTYVGFSEMLGASQEDVQKSMQKLLAVQAISNGVREIANQLTERGTLANKGYAFMQGLVATATNASATATARFAATLKLAGIGLLIGGIAYLVIKYNEMAKATGDAAAKRKLLNDVERAAADSYSKEKAQLDSLIATIKTEGISRKAKMEIIEELQSKYPGYFDNIKTEGDLNEKLALAYEKASKGILLKARAQAAGDLLAQNEAKKLNAELKLSDEITSINQKLTQGIINVGGKDGIVKELRMQANARRKTAAETYSQTVAEIDKQNETLLATITNSNLNMDKLGGKVTSGGSNVKKDKPQDYTADINKRAAEQRKADFELSKLITLAAKEEQKVIADNEANTSRIRIQARLNQFELERQLMQKQKDFEIKEINTTASQEIATAQKEIKNKAARHTIINAIQEKAATERQILNEKFAQEEIELNTTTASALIAIRKTIADAQAAQAENDSAIIQAGIERDYNARIDALESGLTREIDFIDRSKNEKIKKLNEEYTSGRINKEQHEVEKIKIESEALKRSLEQQIKYYKTLAGLYFIDETARKEALNRIAELEKQLSNIGVEDKGKAVQSAQERAAAIKEAFVNLANELKGLTFDLFTGGLDRERNKIQEEIDLLETKKQKEIELVAQSVKNETDKAAQISIIQARASAQKEQMERRQRQLDEQRARYERAAAIADVIGNTAQGITSALASTPPNIPLSIVVGAIGAAQIARIASQPLPKYFRGKTINDTYEGLAWVGDGGKSETIIRENGEVQITPASDTLTWLGKNDIVLPDTTLVDNMGKSTMQLPEASLKDWQQSMMHVVTEKTMGTVNQYQQLKMEGNKPDLSKIEMSLYQLRKELVTTIKNKRELHLKVGNAKEIIFSDGSNRSQYYNNNLQG